VLLIAPAGKGMGGGSDGGEAELVGDSADGGAQPDELFACFIDSVADAGADLDLRAQELRADLAPVVEQGLLAFGEEGRGRFLRQVAAVLVDEEVFLFDADCEAWLADRHGGAMWHNRMTACSRFASIG